MPVQRQFLYFLPLLLLLGYGMKRSLSAPASDFAGYYAGSREIIHGRYPNTYDLQTLNALIRADGYTGNFVSYAPFPPFTAFVFAPFLLFSLGTAKVVFNLFCCGVALFTVWRCRRVFGGPAWLVLAVPVVFCLPIVNNLLFGQTYLLLCFLLVEGFIAYREKRPVMAAVLWGIAILLKLTPAFLFGFLLLRRQWRQAAWLAGVCLLLLGVSVFFTGLPVWKFYISEMLPKMNKGELNDSFTYVFQSAYMLLKRTFLYDGLLNPSPVVNSPWLFVGAMAAFKALILAPVVLVSFRGRDEWFAFGLWVIASMLISPNGSSYSLVLLLIPLWALAPAGRMILVPAAVVLGAACWVAVMGWGHFPVWGQFPRLYALLVFFGVLVVWSGRNWNPWLVLGMAAVFFVPDIRNYWPAEENSWYVLPREEHLFISGYGVKDHRLVYQYENDRGTGEQGTAIVVQELKGDGIQLKDNQIWYEGRVVTASRDWKRQPMIMDGKWIIYLSDDHRGSGFYTLRAMKLPVATVPGAFR